jgi:YD repeat-containing protein
VANATVTASVLDMYGASLTSYQAASKTAVQDVRPRFDQRGVDMDGTLRAPMALGWAVAGDSVGGGYSGGRTLGDVNLFTGSYGPTDVDLALPTLGLPVVIGRTYSDVQVDSGGSRFDSGGYQGFNWASTVQPELVFFAAEDNDNDMLYLVYGADRYIEFKRLGLSATEFKSKNGAAGVIKFTAGESGAPDLYTYYDQRGNKMVFFGFNTAAGVAAGQLWTMTDPGGNVAYAGHATTASTAISSGFDGSGRMAAVYDASGRKYAFSYSTYGGLTRLQKVEAQLYVSSTWTTIAQVEYDYYTTTDNDKGLAGDLRLVTITMKGTGGTDYVRRKYYRYYTRTWDDSDGRRGQAHQLKMVVGFDGVRQYDATGTGFYTASDSTLKPYSETFFEYVSASDYRIKAVTFQGNCGCSGGTSGTFTLGYADGSTYSTEIGNTSYDTAWAKRTVLAQPDGTYVSQYFDETGAVLARVLTNGDPSGSPSKKWVAGIDRNSSGQVTTIHSPANATGYTHSSGAITYSTSAGLVTTYARHSASDNMDGLRDSISVQEGTSGTAGLTSSVTITDVQLSVGSTGVSVPTLTHTKTYPDGGTTGLDTTIATTYWSTTTTDVLYIAPKTVTVTNPTVSTTKLGSGTATTNARYVRQDGSTAFTQDGGGILFYTGQSAFGQTAKQISDCNTGSTGDYLSGDAPSTWSLSSTSGAIHAITSMTYDDQGRPLTTTRPSVNGTITSARVYLIDDNRLGTMSFPRKVSSTYYGPASYSRINHAGRVDRQTIIQVSSSGTSTVPGVTPSASDWSAYIDTVYDQSGMRATETWTYTGYNTSTSSWVHDTASIGYDAMGRRSRSVDATGTITRSVFDERGMTVERWVGTNDHGWSDPAGSSSGTADMVKVEAMEFDNGASGGGGNGLLTGRTQDADGNWSGTSDQRVTTIIYDYRGRAVVQLNPVAPHTVTKYDNSNRAIAVGKYNSTSGLSVSTDPTATSASTRVALAETFYDERGQVYLSKLWDIDQSTGSKASITLNSQSTSNWYDPSGRLVKTLGGQITKTFYDRLGRVTDRFLLARLNDSAYADALDVSGDVVMEQAHSGLDPATGRVLAQWTIQRAHDSYADTLYGLMDSNADGDPLKLTAANIQSHARPQITGMWYDDWDRVRKSAVYGTNGGSDFNRSTVTEPTTSSATTQMVTSYVFDDFGRSWKVTDPAGIENRTEYDFAGRSYRTIDNYHAGTPGGSGGTHPDQDRIVEYAYGAGGLVAKVIRRMPSSGDDQETDYDYTANGGSQVNANNLLVSVTYPEQSSGQSADDRSVLYTYNALSQVLTTRDPAKNVITTTYDNGGRVIVREATTISSGFDSRVARIETSYNSRGKVADVLQKDSGGTVLDEVAMDYDGWGNQASFTEDPDSAIGASSGRDEYAMTWSWARSNLSGGCTAFYMTDWTQPDGTSGGMGCSPTYGVTSLEVDWFARRPLRISDPYSYIAEYCYMGASTVVGTNHPESQMVNNYKLFVSASSTYDTYMDHFNRPILDQWRRDITGSIKPKVLNLDVAYDTPGNVKSIVDNVLMDSGTTTPVHTFDMVSSYDDLRRLTERDDGDAPGGTMSTMKGCDVMPRSLSGKIAEGKVDLNGNSAFIDGPLSSKDAGEMDDTRTYNKRNELTARSVLDKDNTSTGRPVSLTYDLDGNLTNDGETYAYTYNPWGQLVEIDTYDLKHVVAKYNYNGLGQRISEQTDTNNTSSVVKGTVTYSANSGVTDGEVDSSDPVFFIAVDPQGRRVATFRGTDQYPKEYFVYNQAGFSGRGGASGPAFAGGGGVLLRARNSSLSDPTQWALETAPDTCDERTYYCSDFKGNVSALVDSSGKLVEQYRYSPTGVPFGIPLGSVKSDGAVDGNTTTGVDYLLTDYIRTHTYQDRADLNLDGVVNSSDLAIVNANDTTAGGSTGKGVLSTAFVMNNRAFGGYEACGTGTGVLSRSAGFVASTGLGRLLQSQTLFDTKGRRIDQSGVSKCKSCQSPPLYKATAASPDPIIRIDEDCEETWRACQGHIGVKIALQYMQTQCSNKKSGGCAAWNFVCSESEGGDPETHCANCTITVNVGQACDKIAHELIHAGDFCQIGRCNGGLPGDGAGNTDCRAFACTEVRANWLDCCSQFIFRDPAFPTTPRVWRDPKDCFEHRIDVYRRSQPKGCDIDWGQVISECTPFGGDCSGLGTGDTPFPPMPY